MSAQISKELESAMFCDAKILDYLSACEAAFNSGNRSALFNALTICARAQAVIPDWAADALIEGEDELNKGERKDFNEMFGWTGSNRRARKREGSINQNASTVIAKLIDHRGTGGSLNVDQAFGKISDETGVPRRVVEEIYKRYGENIKKIPQGNPEGITHISIFSVLPWPRRRGRPIL